MVFEIAPQHPDNIAHRRYQNVRTAPPGGQGPVGMVSQLGRVTNHHRLANMSSQRIEGVIHVAQMDPPSLKNLLSQAMLGKIFYTLL